MSDIAPVPSHGIQSKTGAATPGRPVDRTQHADRQHPPGRGAEARSVKRGDVVELSEGAKALAKLDELPPERRELILRLRGEIAAGTYETPERIAGAIHSLAKDLGLES